MLQGNLARRATGVLFAFSWINSERVKPVKPNQGIDSLGRSPRFFNTRNINHEILMVEGHWRPGCEACRWNHFCSLGATHLQKMNGDCGSENQTTLPGKKAEKLDSWSWSCQAVIGVDWIYFIFTPFLLVEIPPSSMIQQIFMVGPIPMSLGKSHHACCILFVCLLFLSRWKVDPTQGVQGTTVGPIFCTTNHL